MKNKAPGIVDVWGLTSAYRIPAELASLRDSCACLHPGWHWLACRLALSGQICPCRLLPSPPDCMLRRNGTLTEIVGPPWDDSGGRLYMTFPVLRLPSGESVFAASVMPAIDYLRSDFLSMAAGCLFPIAAFSCQRLGLTFELLLSL